MNCEAFDDLARFLLTLLDNSDDVEHDYHDQFLLGPYIFVAAYDPRLDLARAVHCGLVTFQRVPALASNALTLSASTISDPRRYITPASDCQDFYRQTLSLQDPPYTSYSFSLGSIMVRDISFCDLNVSSSASCVSEALLRFDSKIVTNLKSNPGDRKDHYSGQRGGCSWRYSVFHVLLRYARDVGPKR